MFESICLAAASAGLTFPQSCHHRPHDPDWTAIPEFADTPNCGFLSPGRPGDFHPKSPTDPDVNLSIHPTRPEAAGFNQDKEFLRLPVDSILTWVTCSLRSTDITPLPRSRATLVGATAIPFLHDQPAMPGEQSLGRDNLSHLSERLASQSLTLTANRRRWSSLKRIALAQLLVQHSVLFSTVVDQLQLLLVHLATNCDQQEPERCQGFRHEEGNIITGSPAVHGPVGDPLQIYVGRFSTRSLVCPFYLKPCAMFPSSLIRVTAHPCQNSSCLNHFCCYSTLYSEL